MNLLLLKRDPNAWKARQTSTKEAPTPSADDKAKLVPRSAPKRPLEQLHAGGDDIDKLFDSALVKKKKRSALPSTQEEKKVFMNPDVTGLESVLGAIKDAPKEEKGRKYKKKKAL